MKLTKGMKKALSLLLSAAMVVTGVNVSTGTADAAGTTKSWTGTIQFGSAWDTGDFQLEADENVDLTVTQLDGNKTAVGFDVDVSEYDEPEVTVVASEGEDDNKQFTVRYNHVVSGDSVETATEDDEWQTPKATLKKTFSIAQDATSVNLYVMSRTVTAIYVHEHGVDPTEGIGGDDHSTMINGEAPAKGSMEEFAVKLAAFDDGWGTLSDAKAAYIKVTENGEYTLTVTAPKEGKLMMAWLDTNLSNNSFPEGFVVKAKSFAVGETVYDLDTQDGYFCWADGNPDNVLDKESEGQARVNIVNQYNNLAGEDMSPDDKSKGVANAFGDTELPTIAAGDVIKVVFTVAGMDKEKDTVNYVTKYPDKYQPEEEGTPTPPTGNTPKPGKPGGTTSGGGISNPTTTNKPNTPTTNNAVSAAGIKKITVPKAKKTVIVAPNKSKTVSFTKTLDPSTATKSAIVTASIKNKKIVASATVKEGTTPQKGSVAIKAAKKATKGASTTVTLSSKDAAGKTVSANITVKIQNKVKKVKAAKKAVVIKKKGKTAKVVLKVTAENKKKATTDTVTAKSKVATIKSAKASKGKITVTLKGKKKGSQKVTFKVGKKKVKVKVTVKK